MKIIKINNNNKIILNLLCIVFVTYKFFKYTDKSMKYLRNIYILLSKLIFSCSEEIFVLINNDHIKNKAIKSAIKINKVIAFFI
jgi:hypothetical protein